MRLRAAIASAAVLIALLAPAAAQNWPTRQPIKLIVPFPPGSALDTIGRPVFEQVGKQIGQTFVFENRPGAGGTLGMAQAAKADRPRSRPAIPIPSTGSGSACSLPPARRRKSCRSCTTRSRRRSTSPR